MLSGFMNVFENNTIATVAIVVFAFGSLIDIICLFKDKDSANAIDYESDVIGLTEEIKRKESVYND